MKKYKAIAIPVSFIDGKPRFLTVRDWRFKDWIFVTGGCRRREIFILYDAHYENWRRRHVELSPSRMVNTQNLNLYTKKVQR